MTTYRPQPLWLLMGPLLGGLAGAVTGAVMIFGSVLLDPYASGTDLLVGLGMSLYLGGTYGGVCGAVVGLFAGLPLVFLVGRHLPRDVAGRRAWALGLLVPPLTLLLAAALLTDAEPAWPREEDAWFLVPLVGSSLLGSVMARWAATIDEPRQDVS